MSLSVTSDSSTFPFFEHLVGHISNKELPLRLLLVEDSRLDAILIQRLLEKMEDGIFLTEWVSSVSAAFEVLKTRAIDVILLDLYLVDSHGLDTFYSVSTFKSDVPIVVLTGHDDREQGLDAIRWGAQDYLIKGHVKGDMLIRSLIYAIERKQIELNEKKKAELHLKENEMKFRQLFDYESDALLVLDVETERFEESNQAAVLLFGYSKEEFHNVTIKTLSIEKEKTQLYFEQISSGEISALQLPVLHFRTKGGRIFPGEIAVRSFVMEGRVKLIASIRDITLRKKMEDDLRKSEQRFRMLIESAADAFFLHDLSGRILDVNEQSCKSLGYSREELLMMSIVDLDSQFAQVALSDIWMKLDSGLPITIEGTHQRRDGSSFPVEVRLGRFSSEDEPLLLSLVRDISQRKVEEARRLFNAYYDGLTRLPNRTMFLRHLDSMGDVKENSLRFSVLFLDLDRFKKINDSLGHEAGDSLIIETAARLKKCLREGDILARFSADEFALFYQVEELSDVHNLVEMIKNRMEEPFSLRGQEAFCSLSMGISLNATGYSQSSEMLRDAEIALHHAKTLGRAQVVIFDKKMRDAAIHLHQMETSLRHAIEREELVVFYQPIIDLKQGVIYAFEALVRWEHPEQGLLSPDRFLGVAEDFGLLSALGWQILEKSCQQAQEWNTTLGLSVPIRMSVNVSSSQFEQGELLERVELILEKTNLPPEFLKLEMTETTLMEHSDIVMSVIDKLNQKGITFSMDDFGTGYSSLSYLHQFPVRGLKIDRSFVSRMMPDNQNTEIVQTIVALAQLLDLSVIAEGIETPEHLEQLRDLGCDFGQGYYFSPPVNAKDAKALLQAKLRW